MVEVFDPEETTYQVSKWDQNMLIASTDEPDSSATSKCHIRVVTMHFASGVVTDTDMPTHKQGCDAFKIVNTYRLKRGNYFIDLSANNDLDLPYKAINK